jgi:putative DNA primase/helicase
LRLIAGEKLVFTPEKGWLSWDDYRFSEEDGDALARGQAHKVVEFIKREEHPKLKAWVPPPDGVNDSKVYAKLLEAHKKRVAALWRFAIQTGNSYRTAGLLQQAQVKYYKLLRKMDPDGDWINTKSGMLNVVNMEVRDCAPADLCTRVTGAKFNPDSKAPVWKKHLEKVQPDPEMRKYLQRVLGYAALQDGNPEQCFFMFRGKGGDGKSVTLNAVREVVGDYVQTADISTFLHDSRKSGAGPSPDLARLAGGTRLVLCSEPPAGARLGESELKQWTGGEPMVARHLMREPFEFIPRASLIISCNRKPKIFGDDRGIWRRTRIVPWPVSIPANEQDVNIGRKLRVESSGILNWLLDGLSDYLEQGLNPPQEAIDAVEEYRLSSNPFAEWFEESLTPEPNAKHPSKDFYSDYKAWCQENDLEPINITAFGRALTDRDINVRKTGGIKYRIGADFSCASGLPRTPESGK